jgi:uncharacterized membrane protein YhiD involved in acid resistance
MVTVLWLVFALAAPLAAQLPPVPAPQETRASQPPSTLPATSDTDRLSIDREVRRSLIRLPLAAALGALLALRPRRRGTPPRTVAVVQTQIVLAGVGAVIMLVVGASLARAFGIVGAANLIRYRSKVDDPKDAVVMLCALAVGLAAGVGLYVLATIATMFLLALLFVIESFEPSAQKVFELKVTADNEAEMLRPRVEQVLSRFRLPFEGRSLTGNELAYEVQMPFELQTDAISQSIVALSPKTDVGVVWTEKKVKAR